MSNIFAELQEEAAKQQEEASKLKDKKNIQIEDTVSHTKENNELTERNENKTRKYNTNGTVAPLQSTAAPQIDVKKLEIIIKELSTISTRRDGLNVRLSEIEAADIDDFVNDRLRQKGIKGNDISASKLMRYAFRYILRLHEKEFTDALSRALRVKEKLTI